MASNLMYHYKMLLKAILLTAYHGCFRDGELLASVNSTEHSVLITDIYKVFRNGSQVAFFVYIWVPINFQTVNGRTFICIGQASDICHLQIWSMFSHVKPCFPTSGTGQLLLDNMERAETSLNFNFNINTFLSGSDISYFSNESRWFLTIRLSYHILKIPIM